MLVLSDITYSIAGQPLFVGASATIPAGHKVGLVGGNGTGKSTLFRLIQGELPLESGEITLPSNLRIGCVAQEAPSTDLSLRQTVLNADMERADLLREAETATDPLRIGEVQMRLTDIDAWSADGRASAILKGLGFDDDAQARPCSAFSGGWRMRVALAGILFAQPDLLLLDEPTNYLDLEGTVWLEHYLLTYPHTVIIISHDRSLLNTAVGGILHLADRKLTYFQGPYDQFARQRAEQRKVQTAKAHKVAHQRAHLQGFVDRFRYQANKARQAQSRLKMLERLVAVDLPEDDATQTLTFPQPEALSPPIVNLRGGATGYDGSLVLRRLDLRIDQDDRIALLGRNGEGKSTFAKLLAGKLDLMAGTVTTASHLRVGYFAQHQIEELDAEATALDHVTRAKPDKGMPWARAQLAQFGLGPDQALTRVDALSGGEKARLSLLLATLDAPHLLILDEPTNHLDIAGRDALVDALTRYAGAIVIVSHDMHLLGLVADRLWLVQGGTIRVYADDLDTYRAAMLQPATTSATPAPPKPATQASRKERTALRAEVRKCEAVIAQLNDMRDRLALKLSDHALYDPDAGGEAVVWQKKYAEVMDGLARAEDLWTTAMEGLDAAADTD